MYQIYTEVSLVKVPNYMKEKHVRCYPSNDVAFLSKRTKVINLPKGLQYGHAEGVADELMETGFYSSYAIVKIDDPR
jgi:hypothetical protein